MTDAMLPIFETGESPPGNDDAPGWAAGGEKSRRGGLTETSITRTDENARTTGRGISVTLGRSWAEVRGHRSGVLLGEVGGRPMWIARVGAWSTSRRRAGDLIALAQARSIPCVVNDTTKVGDVAC